MRKINMNYKRKSYGARLVALSMALMLCVTSCGKKPEKAPELLDPVSTNEAYRPVSKGDVGKKIIKNGSVVPTDYCYFYKSLSLIHISEPTRPY